MKALRGLSQLLRRGAPAPAKPAVVAREEPAEGQERQAVSPEQYDRVPAYLLRGV